jgi:hypothetical protein
MDADLWVRAAVDIYDLHQSRLNSGDGMDGIGRTGKRYFV